MAPHVVTAEVIVVGAGPAGIAAVLALQGRRVAWIDPEFTSGRLSQFCSVACNTKVDILVGGKFFGHPLLEPVRQAIAPAFANLKEGAQPLPGSVDPSTLGWTNLGAVKCVYDAATQALFEQRHVERVKGCVTRLERKGSDWIATVSGAADDAEVTAPCVVLATGAEPRRVCAEETLTCEDAFDVGALDARLQQGQRVAVLGNSHSAAIALSNLRPFAASLGLQVVNFARRPVRLAKWDAELGTYYHTSTGLKGFGAVVGAECMTQGADWLELRPFESFKQEDWDCVFDCTGYIARALPPIPGVDLSVERDEATGRLGLEVQLPSLFAVGVPWPELPGRLWGTGMEEVDGFKGEHFVGFHLFFERARLIAEEISKCLDMRIAAESGDVMTSRDNSTS